MTLWVLWALGLFVAAVFLVLLYYLDKYGETCESCKYAKKSTCVDRHWSYFCEARDIYVDHGQTCNIYERRTKT